MSDSSVIELPGFIQGRLHSERIRLRCMAALFAAFVLLGNFRIVFPYGGNTALGWIVVSTSAVYLAFELLMLRLTTKSLHTESTLHSCLRWFNAITECLFPLVILFLLMLLHPQDRFTLLVSPGYPFLHVLLAVSVLRVNWQVTALTGLIAAIGYGGLTLYAHSISGMGPINPHPPALYAMLTIMLFISATASVFVAIQFRGYLVRAAREMETRGQRDRLKRDLQIAREIQQQLLPWHTPELAGYQIAAMSRPADETGGDYYDWQPLSTTRVIFSLGDVTGHGIGPALVTSACRAYARATLGTGPSLQDAMDQVNQLLSKDLPEGRFVTLVLVDLHAQTHEALLMSAGHGPTLHVRGKDGTTQRIGSQCMPLGLQEGLPWEKPVRLSMEPGDLLVLVSDGFFEPVNPSGEPFGIDRMEQVLRDNRHLPADQLVTFFDQAVREFLLGEPQADDMTVVVIKRCPA